MSQIAENLLIERFSKGDEGALKELFFRYHPRVKFFLYSVLKDGAEAEDLAQDIFIKLWTDRERMAQVRNIGSYLFVLSRNALYNILERKRVRRTHMEEYDVPEIDYLNAQHVLEEQDLLMLHDMAVLQMPEQRQLVYRMSREEELTAQEIADRLGIATKTVSNHLNLALRSLREVLRFAIILYIN